MCKVFLSLLLSVLPFLYCSNIEQYFSTQEKEITLSTSTESPENITGVTFDSGEIIVFYNSTSDSITTIGNFMYQKSSNSGFSWSTPEKVLPIELTISNPFATKLRDQSLILVFNEVLNDLNSQNYFYLIRSYDFGKTFTAPRMVEIPGYREVKITGKVVQVGKSILFLPLQAKNKENKTLCLLLFSDNKGKSWEKVFEITSATNNFQFTNPVLINLEDKRLYCLLEEKNGYFYSIFSCDTGKTWTEPECTKIYGSSGSLLRSSGGYLVCCYEDKTPQGVSMMKSFDLGKTWEGEMHLIDRSNMVLKPYLLSLNNSKTLLLYTQRDSVTDGNKSKWQLQGRLITLKRIKAPRAVVASLSSEGIQLRWNKVEKASYYIVYRSISSDTALGSEHRIAKTTINNYVDRSLNKEGKYYYSVSAVEGYGKLLLGTGSESEPSEPFLINFKIKK
ncbi:MAG: sialidase family protein [bacterium]